MTQPLATFDLTQMFWRKTAKHHRRPGDHYILREGAILQTETRLEDNQPMCVYMVGDGNWYVRSMPEMNDGRFTFQTQALPPSVGANPLGEVRPEGVSGLQASEERLRYAYVFQQAYVPPEMALVWRVDIGRVRSDYIRVRALAEVQREQIAKLEEQVASLRDTVLRQATLLEEK